MSDVLHLLALVLTAFVGWAEIGSFGFVHPVLTRTLDSGEYLRVQQGLLKTFGRVMPFAMTGAAVASIALAVDSTSVFTIVAAIAAAAGLVSTIGVNVGINIRTGRWDPDDPPDGWRATRRLWWIFQGLRGVLFAGASNLIAAASIFAA